jgi:hypothetical protein
LAQLICFFRLLFSPAFPHLLCLAAYHIHNAVIPIIDRVDNTVLASLLLLTIMLLQASMLLLAYMLLLVMYQAGCRALPAFCLMVWGRVIHYYG